jgi:ribosome biogenesis GTPase / thiamine phosphate phosphatase
MNDNLLNLGFNEKAIAAAASAPGLVLGRVIAQYKNIYKVATATAELLAEISGKLAYCNNDPLAYPVVGDFVLLDRADDAHGQAIIQQLLERKSIFLRKAAGTAHQAQAVAANIDTAFICMSLNNDFNLRRLERYLSIVWDSGALPVVVLTKADLSADLVVKIAEVESVAMGADILTTSSVDPDGYYAVLKYLLPGKTVVFLGSSGVGKSTLINRLLGKDVLATGAIGKDDSGRHITARRELFVLPTGGAVIDTPGMRELGLESADLARSFHDIDELAVGCRFADCQHDNEPGCAVQKAISDGLINEERLASYHKLQKEVDYQGLNSRQIDKEKLKTMYDSFDGVKNAKKFVKAKNKS